MKSILETKTEKILNSSTKTELTQNIEGMNVQNLSNAEIVQMIWEIKNKSWSNGYNQGKYDPDYED